MGRGRSSNYKYGLLGSENAVGFECDTVQCMMRNSREWMTRLMSAHVFVDVINQGNIVPFAAAGISEAHNVQISFPDRKRRGKAENGGAKAENGDGGDVGENGDVTPAKEDTVSITGLPDDCAKAAADLLVCHKDTQWVVDMCDSSLHAHSIVHPNTDTTHMDGMIHPTPTPHAWVVLLIAPVLRVVGTATRGGSD